MIHDLHRGPHDAVLYDGCAECDRRAASPLDGLLALDRKNFSRLAARVRAVEWGDTEHYRTVNEARIGLALYRLLVLIERHPGTLT